MTAAILAHQGGWDEALFVIGPLALIIVLLRKAKRRADAATQVEPASDPAPIAEDTSSADPPDA